jgi:uncharacterized iron-regulated membrane protein
MAASKRTLVILYSLHSWAGIITGLLLFIVCFSGSVMVFREEIDAWANPSAGALPRMEQPVAPDAVLASLARQYPDSRSDMLLPPDDVNPSWSVYAKLADGASVKLAARADTGAIVGPVDSQLGQFLRTLHVFLFFGPRWIVGFLGVAMLFLIVSGFVIHRKIVKELFTVRWRKSLRLSASDLHKGAGVWALGFHLLIAFTGAWLGLAPVFERGYAFVSGMGGVAGSAPTAPAPATRAKTGSGAVVSLPPLDALLARALVDMPGLTVERISLRNPGKPNAAVVFYGAVQDSVFSKSSIVYDLASGKVNDLQGPATRGFWGSFNLLLKPLHFGDYGGLVMKWLYFLLGMTPALLSLSGTLLWIERRKLKQAQRRGTTVLAGGAKAEHV